MSSSRREGVFRFYSESLNTSGSCKGSSICFRKEEYVFEGSRVGRTWEWVVTGEWVGTTGHYSGISPLSRTDPTEKDCGGGDLSESLTGDVEVVRRLWSVSLLCVSVRRPRTETG